MKSHQSAKLNTQERLPSALPWFPLLCVPLPHALVTHLALIIQTIDTSLTSCQSIEYTLSINNTNNRYITYLKINKESQRTFNIQLELTKRLPGFISRWIILAEWRYLSPAEKRRVTTLALIPLWYISASYYTGVTDTGGGRAKGGWGRSLIGASDWLTDITLLIEQQARTLINCSGTQTIHCLVYCTCDARKHVWRSQARVLLASTCAARKHVWRSQARVLLASTCSARKHVCCSRTSGIITS